MFSYIHHINLTKHIWYLQAYTCTLVVVCLPFEHLLVVPLGQLHFIRAGILVNWMVNSIRQKTVQVVASLRFCNTNINQSLFGRKLKLHIIIFTSFTAVIIVCETHIVYDELPNDERVIYHICAYMFNHICFWMSVSTLYRVAETRNANVYSRLHADSERVKCETDQRQISKHL